MLLLTMLIACQAPATDDTAAVVEDSAADPVDSGTAQDCSKVSIRVDGNDPPSVGDDWTMFLWCDEVLLLGSTVVRFEPPEIARLEANNATFVEPGEAKLYMQVGRWSASRDVAVADTP